MGLSPYEKKSYRESKRRRKQALIESETGRIVPYKRRRNTIITVALCAVVTLAVVFAFLAFSQAGKNGEQPVEAVSGKLSDEELLRVVNRLYPLDSDYVPDLTEAEGVSLNPEAASALVDFTSFAKKQGIGLKAVRGYVSYEEQKKLYEANLAKFSADPKYTPVRAQAAAKRLVPEAGCCEAQTGLLVGFDVSNPHTKAFLERECINYGFILRYPEGKDDITHIEPSQSLYRYVGVENAVKMRSFDMCLEEYADYTLRD